MKQFSVLYNLFDYLTICLLTCKKIERTVCWHNCYLWCSLAKDPIMYIGTKASPWTKNGRTSNKLFEKFVPDVAEGKVFTKFEEIVSKIVTARVRIRNLFWVLVSVLILWSRFWILLWLMMISIALVYSLNLLMFIVL